MLLRSMSSTAASLVWVVVVTTVLDSVGTGALTIAPNSTFPIFLEKCLSLIAISFALFTNIFCRAT